MNSFPKLAAVALLLSSCALGGRVSTGPTYAAVAPQSVEILFQAPAWPARQIGIVSSQGSQMASDATTYKELQSQASKLGADAVLIVSATERQYASFPGIATFNADYYQANAFAIGPQAYVGLNLQGIALRRVQ